MPNLNASNLVEQLSQALARQISSNARTPGSRLPTEDQLAAEFGVSRTVVREAISRLKADGLVVTRQGLGAFVSASLKGMPFRIAHEAQDPHRVVHDVFELRIGVEAEAAALAAERATALQIREIGAALKAVNQAGKAGMDGIEEDLRFHRAIARAANNRVYDDLVEFLERYTRDQLLITRRNRVISGWAEQLQREHTAIYDAIAAHDRDGARSAAHGHLHGGIKRLKVYESH